MTRHEKILRRVLSGTAEILNLQPRPGGEAKPYQVRQVREVILRYGLAAELGEKEEFE